MKKITITIIALVLVVSGVLPSGIAKAASAYDSAFTSWNDVNLKNQSCGSGGINDYNASLDDILDAVESHSTYGSQISSAMASGNIGVSNFTAHTVNGSVVSNSIQVFWTPDDSLYLEWINANYGSPYHAVYAHGATSTLTSVFVNATNDLFGNCHLTVSSTGFSNLAVVSEALTDGGVRSSYLEVNDPNYPTSYAGAPVGYHIQGEVMCTNTSNVISAVNIDADTGPDRNAELTDIGNGVKQYSHYLTTGEPYSLIVICDGDPFYGPTVEDNFGYYYNWQCTVTGDQHYCAAA